MATCDEHGLLPLEEALARLAAAVPAPDSGEILADRDDPALDRSAMDGAALRSVDGVAPRRVLGTLFAGDDPAAFRIGPGDCVRLMTGACLPEGADAIVPVELLRREGDLLAPTEPPKAGDHIRRRGSQARKGEVLLPAGAPRSAAADALRAQVGAALPALRRARVGVASTGDELAAEPRPHQIRDSNGPMLTALAHRLGADPVRLPSLPDDEPALRARLQDLNGFDVLLTSGGVSMGEKDLLPDVLRELGAELLFHKIRLKPGKPMLAARLGPTIILGLPGNPVSAYLNSLLFLPVALARLEGRRLPDPWRQGELAAPVKNKGDRPLLTPCALDQGLLTPLRSQGSGDLVTLARAAACAWIQPGGAEAGAVRYLELI
ncbi:MAG TPA: molybdopterin molybdotransferase MoeA [Holophagaceae bacterium]|nr:molybdopterin molybdotransferase MoeA [Holophagaceae bacterium]